MRIPSWAPKALTAELPRTEERARAETEETRAMELSFGGISNAEILQILLRLMTDSRMEMIWARLERRAKQFRVDSGRGDARHYSVSVFGACIAGIGQWRMRPKATRAEMKEVHLNISKRADQLLALLETETGSWHKQHSFYPEELATLGKTLKLSPARWPDGTENYGANPWLHDLLPGIDVFLKRLKSNALAIAENPKAMVGRENDPDAGIRFAALWLLRHFRDCYGQPLYSTVATITNVVHESDVMEDDVRGWDRTRKQIIDRTTRKIGRD